MDTEIDWHQEMDRAIGHAPDRPVTDFLPAGRGAVRRRRLASGIAAAAAAAVLSGATWTMMPDTSSGPLAPATATQSPPPSDPGVPSDGADPQEPPYDLPPDQWLRLTPDGHLQPAHPSVDIVMTSVSLPVGKDGDVLTFGGDDDYEGLVHLRVGGRDAFATFEKSGSHLRVLPSSGSFRNLDDFRRARGAQRPAQAGAR